MEVGRVVRRDKSPIRKRRTTRKTMFWKLEQIAAEGHRRKPRRQEGRRRKNHLTS